MCKRLRRARVRAVRYITLQIIQRTLLSRVTLQTVHIRLVRTNCRTGRLGCNSQKNGMHSREHYVQYTAPPVLGTTALSSGHHPPPTTLPHRSHTSADVSSSPLTHLGASDISVSPPVCSGASTFGPDGDLKVRPVPPRQAEWAE